MCVRPLKIKNPKIKAGTFINGVDSEWLSVPCGHCSECNLRRVKDLTFRCYQEYLNCKSQGGFTVFQTLTYSNQFVPESNGMHFFCKSDVQKFNKRLRKLLQKFVGVYYTYVVTMEYGSSPDGTHRPHYHVIFNVYGHISPVQFDELVVRAWCYMYKKVGSEPIGRTDPKLTNLRIVNSIYAIQYICKYVYKGTCVRDALLAGSHSTSHLSYWLSERLLDKGKSLNQLEDYEIVPLWLCYVKHNPQFKDYQLFPCYLQSKGLGMGWLETGCYEDLFDVVLLDSNNQYGYTKYHIPNYYIRKVFYRYDKLSKRFILNDLGVEYKKSVHDKMFHDYLVDNKIEYSKVVDELLDGRSMSDFAYYAVYLRGKHIAPKYFFLLDGDYLTGHVKDFCDMYEDEQLTQLVADQDFDWPVDWFYSPPVVEENANKPYTNKYALKYDDLPCFSGFNKLYDYLLSVRQAFSKAHCKQISEEIEIFKEQKIFKSAVSNIHPLIY